MALAVLLHGCASYEIKYRSCVQGKMAPTKQAAVVWGHMGRAPEMLQRIDLPHYSEAEKTLLRIAVLREFTSQLGSDDYVLIGTITGSGNAKATFATLGETMARRAAREGGEVVLIVASALARRHVVLYSQNIAVGRELQLPQAVGLVFRYLPGTVQGDGALESVQLALTQSCERLGGQGSQRAESQPAGGPHRR